MVNTIQNLLDFPSQLGQLMLVFSGVCSFMDLSCFSFFLDGWEVVEGLFLGGRFEPIGYCITCVSFEWPYPQRNEAIPAGSNLSR